jgi:hypothetical protein
VYLAATGDHPPWHKIKNLADEWLIVIFGVPVEFHKKYFSFQNQNTGFSGTFYFRLSDSSDLRHNNQWSSFR